MTAKLIEKNEHLYLGWINANPSGYVLNIGADNNPKHRTLHRATCRSISTYQSDKKDGAFTCRGYRKVVAQDVSSIESWVDRNRGGSIRRCKLCMNSKNEIITLEALTNHIEVEVQNSKRNRKARKRRLEHASKKPEIINVLVAVYKRNPDVIAEVLERAEGFCEECKSKAPFERASDKSPYLEVHHKKRLADDGDDTVENAIALCPNCHRKAHYGGGLKRSK